MLVQIIEKTLDAISKRGPNSAAPDEKKANESNDQLADDACPAPKRLAWKLDDETRRAIDAAAIDVDR